MGFDRNRSAIAQIEILSADQIRAGRALLRWSARDLAGKAGVGISTVQRMEGADDANSSLGSLAAVQRALEEGGVEFIAENGGGPGVRLKKRTKR